MVCDTIGPFQGLPLSSTLNQIKPEIIFYKRSKNGKSNQVILKLTHKSSAYTLTNNSEFVTNLQSAKKVILISHGFTPSKSWLPQMRDTLLQVGTNQIVGVIGWSILKGQFPADYKQSVANCQVVGKWLTNFLTPLQYILQEGKSQAYLWGIGHCLGAHLLGITGKFMNECGYPFNRIIALDPSGPGFQSNLKGYRCLTQSDAKLVDVIHTDSMPSLESPSIYYGTVRPMGHYDFYPNFGHSTCNSSDTSDHNLACELFTWSVTNKSIFKTKMILSSAPKVSWDAKGNILISEVKETKSVVKAVELGYHLETTETKGGCYYLQISKQAPYIYDFVGDLVKKFEKN